MMMLDLDHFKSINDNFGHAIGDEVLRTFADVARSSMRASDIIGRLGGEEFAVIVAEPMDLAVRIAERLRAAFEEAGVTVGGHAIGATISIGAAASYEPLADLSSLLGRADAALYRAKHDGRNRVHTADDRSVPRQVAPPIAAGRGVPAMEPARVLQFSSHARRAKSARAAR
jgi:diguanylate cyclase (GGDEF)-like protein